MLDPDRVPGPAFGLAEDLPRMETDWHAHARAQLLFCTEGALRVYAADRMIVLPPERAAWVPGGCAHRVVTGRPVRLRTVYFRADDTNAGGPDDAPLTVFSAPPLLREMARQACAWGPSPPERPEVAPFYAAFLGLVRGWRAEGALPSLPGARSEGLRRALDALVERLDRPVGLEDAARAGGLSVRTLQRRCREELGTNLQEWLVRARVARATELLADPSLSVGEVALRCGYETPSAFTRAFQRVQGVSPRAWRGGEEGGSLHGRRLGAPRS